MKKLFYLNFNSEHSAGEQSIYDYNKDNIKWHSTKVPIFPTWTGVAHLWYDFTIFSSHMSVDEIGKPLFDYYRQHGNFDKEKIQAAYYPQAPSLPHLEETISNLEKNIADVRAVDPDIIFIRFYFGFEFLVYYFLKAIEDLDCKVILGGNVINYADPYFLDIFFNEGLIDNYHVGYGEKHLANIINDVELPQQTTDLETIIDDYTIPRAETHWLKTTTACNGGCKFCALLINNTETSGVNMTSVAYIDFLMQRIKYLEAHGVKYLISPGSITFFNKAHIRLFYQKYKEHNLKMIFIDSFFKFSDFDAEIVFMLQDMNFYSIKIGLETVNVAHREQLGKYFSNALVIQTIELLRHSNIKFKLSMLFNTPFDTIESTTDNLLFLKKHEVQYYALNRFYMVNHTDLYDNHEQYNLTKYINDAGYIIFTRDDCGNKYNEQMRDMEQQFYANINVEYRKEYLMHTDKFYQL